MGSHNGTGTVHRLSHHATSVVHSIADQAASTAVASAERAKGMTSTITSVGRDRSSAKPEVQDTVADLQQKITEEMIPTLRDVALQAASLAVELWQTGRERAASVAETAQHEIPPQAAHLRDTATKRASEIRAAAAKRALEAKELGARRAAEASYSVADRATDVADRAKSASKHAADTTVDTTKDTGALIFWSGAAAGVVFFAFLDKKRRDQVLKFASDAIHRAQGMIADMRQNRRSTFSEGE